MRIQSTGATRYLCAKLWSGSKERETAGAMEIVSASGTRLDSAPGVIQDWVSDGKKGIIRTRGIYFCHPFWESGLYHIPICPKRFI